MPAIGAADRKDGVPRYCGVERLDQAGADADLAEHGTRDIKDERRIVDREDGRTAAFQTDILGSVDKTVRSDGAGDTLARPE